MTTVPSPNLISVSETNGLRADVNLHGAELWRLIDTDGADLLWSGDPAIWRGRAPILFPIVGELAGGGYRYREHVYSLPRHGFARLLPFSIIEQAADRVLLRLAACADTRKVYPFEFQLDLGFTCAAHSLTVSASVTNHGNQPMPFAFGFHPAFRWPLESGADRAGHAISFAVPEPAPVCRLNSDGLVMAERQPSPVEGRKLALNDALFVGDAIIFPELASRSISYGAHGSAGECGRQLDLAFTNLPMLGVWSKPGAGYICLEPWQGVADPNGFQGDIFAKPAIVTLAPGEIWQAQMVLLPRAPDPLCLRSDAFVS
jgi:galactose mutarotase-like enzyme